MVTRDHLRVSGSRHLEVIDTEVVELVRRARDAVIDADVLADVRARTLVATLQLDGSTIDELPAGLADPDTLMPPVDSTRSDGRSPDHVPPGHPDGPHPEGDDRARSSWYGSFQLLEETPDQDILEREVRGVAAAYEADDLTTLLGERPTAALTELHRRLTFGLVDPATAGRLRLSEQVVHDASVGRVLYYTVAPERVEAELAALDAWLTGPAQQLSGLRTAGLLHVELLRIHPFEAANGRLARAAARLWLRKAGLDPQGLAGAEEVLAQQRLAYHEEVAGTLRRRDATPWLERWGDAVAEGLRINLRTAGLLDEPLPARAQAFLAARDRGEAFTLADYRAHTDGDVSAADAELARLLDSGEIAREPGSRGLRYRVR